LAGGDGSRFFFNEFFFDGFFFGRFFREGFFFKFFGFGCAGFLFARGTREAAGDSATRVLCICD